MNWKKYSEEKPPEEQLVLVFRSQKEKYTIAYFKEKLDEEGILRQEWITQHTYVYSVFPDDHWLYFPYLNVTHNKIYS